VVWPALREPAPAATLGAAMTWHDLEEGAPEIARLGRDRLERAGIALLATLRKDGSPRINPVEPHIVEGQLVFAAMPRTTKARDLLRDPRCFLHSVVSDPDGSEGELKLSGRAEELHDPELRERPRDAWWVGRPSRQARLFSLVIERAAFVSWDTARGVMIVRRWSPDGGFAVAECSYP
jgi:Pyridoxamine 5'-phosphate oxidase